MSHPNQALPREFRMAGGGFGAMVLPFALPLVFFAAVMVLLGSIVAGVAGGVVAAVIGVGVLVAVLYAKFARMRQGTVVRFSEYGVELSDAMGFHVRLAWPDMTRVGVVASRMANPYPIGWEDGVRARAGAMTSQGVIGWGDRVIPANAPGWMRRHLAVQPVNPRDGRPEVAIPLGGVDPDWARGPMGQWVRAYRPDLFGPPRTG